MRATFVYHQICAVFSLLGTVIGGWWVITHFTNMDSLKLAMLLLVLSISWGIHALIHFWGEIYYDFSPLMGKDTVYDKPTGLLVKIKK